MLVSFGVGNGMPKKPYNVFCRTLKNNGLNREQWAFPEKKIRRVKSKEFPGLLKK